VSQSQLATARADLYRLALNGTLTISSSFATAVTDVIAFTTEIIEQGFEKAVAEVPSADDLGNRPFIEVADALVERHLRFHQERDAASYRKSLTEAYIRAAGPQYVFEPLRKTRLVRSLRSSGATKFAAMLFSFHLFNLAKEAIHDELRMKVQDVRRFELYLHRLESICSQAVKAAVDAVKSDPKEKGWALAVAGEIERQLLNLCRDQRNVPNEDATTG
jgi:hypothetical protein